MGPPGTGKTHLSVGLGIEALERGHRVSFVAMDTLIHLLKTQDIARTSQTRMKRILGSDLLIIDDLMFMAMEKAESNLFFQFINKLYGQASIILTSNKGPGEWGELLGDPSITTAILDRILHKSEVVQLSGDSFRLKHRDTTYLAESAQKYLTVTTGHSSRASCAYVGTAKGAGNGANRRRNKA